MGVRFISLNDAYDSAKLNGATGGIDIAFRNLIYELYSHDLSEKVRSAKMSAAKSGRSSNSEAFYGYIKDPNDLRKLVVDEIAAVNVRRIFDLAARNYTPSQIAKKFNDESVPTPQERKMQLGSRRRYTSGEATFWYSSVILLIVHDERYAGTLIYGKTRIAEVGGKKQVSVPKSEWIVVPGAIPAIITQEQYETANRNSAKRQRPESKRPQTTLLFSRKLRCAYCGMAMKTIHRTRDVKYYCGTPRLTDKYGCADFRVFEKDIADVALAALQHQIAFADETRKTLEVKAEKLIPGIANLRGEVSRLNKLIEKCRTTKIDLWEKYHNGGISAESFQRENEKADEQAKLYADKVAETDIAILALEAETGRENVFVERFSKQAGITKLTREVVEEFISEIKMYSPERIEIIFNYSDEYAKIAELTK
jgi:hypothetical protein